MLFEVKSALCVLPNKKKCLWCYALLSTHMLTIVVHDCAYIRLFGKPHYFMNGCPLQPLDPPCFDCTLLVHITTTPTIRHSTIISATPPSILTKTVAITAVLDIGAGEGSEFRVKFIQTNNHKWNGNTSTYPYGKQRMENCPHNWNPLLFKNSHLTLMSTNTDVQDVVSTHTQCVSVPHQKDQMFCLM